MNLQAERQSIINSLDLYRKRLDEIPDDQFMVTPPNGGWSFAEVYCHIMLANFGSSVAIEKCCRKTAEATTKGPSLLGRLMMFTGRFPPVKAKTPAVLAAKVTPISKEEARNQLIRFRKRLDELMPMVGPASLNYKIKHPRLGLFNARQWLKFIRIHSLHHLKQLERIKKSFPQM